MNRAKNLLILILLIAVAIFFIRDCNSDRSKEIIEKVDITTISVKEPIKTLEIGSVRKVHYQVLEIEGKERVVYRDTATGETREANQYDTKLNFNKATADLKITTTGDLIDVTGTIDYPFTTKTITREVFKEKSGLFAYGQGGTAFGVGLDYQFKNKVIVGGSAVVIDNKTYFLGKFGIKVW